MTDEELAKFLGIDNDERWPRVVAKLDPKKRAAYERMAQLEMELALYGAGLCPKPKGAILCYPHKHKPRRKRAHS